MGSGVFQPYWGIRSALLGMCGHCESRLCLAGDYKAWKVEWRVEGRGCRGDRKCIAEVEEGRGHLKFTHGSGWLILKQRSEVGGQAFKAAFRPFFGCGIHQRSGMVLDGA